MPPSTPITGSVSEKAHQGPSSFTIALQRSLRTYERSAEIDAKAEEEAAAQYEQEVLPMLAQITSEVRVMYKEVIQLCGNWDAGRRG